MSRNPYLIKGHKPTLQLSVFAFMDILGYSEMIRQSEKTGTQQPLLRKLHNALAQGRAWLEDKSLSPALRRITE